MPLGVTQASTGCLQSSLLTGTGTFIACCFWSTLTSVIMQLPFATPRMLFPLLGLAAIFHSITFKSSSVFMLTLWSAGSWSPSSVLGSGCFMLRIGVGLGQW